MEEQHKKSAEPAGFPPGLAGLVAQAGQAAKTRPVERWNPPYCGEIGMRIAADGTWLYRGSPIGREALVRLFASILRREPDGRHVLVTPVERVGIEVEDAPFLGVEMVADGRAPSAASASAPMSATSSRQGPTIRCASKRRPKRVGSSPMSACAAASMRF